ncbi:M23 family metallopeptidase [Croceibacterium selenioxidans]|nr:M23 family metallopeptidase [Croceibacterium selenioxidans]
MFFKLGSVLGLALALVANPAQANETAAATQITGAVDAQNAATGTGDREFAELFASWRSMDTTGIATAPRTKVAIPSMMPVQGVTMTSDYGMRIHPVLGGRRNHKGIDLAGPMGTPVYATADGVVSRAERFSSYGNYIQIEHGGELQTRYAHLSGYAVAAGEQVTKGQLIGYIGTTGRSTGPHLHYEVRVSGEAVDPRPYMLAQVPAGQGGQGGE